jgi:glutathione synthase/RimK-type ligase-like ATP-grasp enzyme
MKIGLLTCRNWAGAYEGEVALAAEIDKKFEVDVLIWNDSSVDWKSYNYLIFRSIWDYFEYPAAFSAWLNMLKENNIKTLNPISVIQQNQHKFYLRDLQQQGIDIIPTVFIPKNTGLNLSFLKDNNWERAVIKPAVSGGAYLTKLFAQSQISEIEAEYLPIAQDRDLLVQPFMPEIQTIGEISLLFFRGIFSHAVLKKPIGDDYRVQSQFGGQYQTYFPTDALIETAKNIIKMFNDELLYARVDGILKNGKFLLMEVELIEPDLYFSHAPNAKKTYLSALEAMITESEPFYFKKS